MRSVFLFVLSAVALVVPAAAAPTCTSQTLSQYVGLGASGCSVGGLLFSNFQYFSVDIAGNPTLVPASEVSVVPIVEPSRPGLSFQANWTVTNGISDHLIFYEVSTLSGRPTISDGYLDWDFSRSGLISVASLDEFLCFDGSLVTGCNVKPVSRFFLRSSSVPTMGEPSNHLSFDPVARVSVLKDVFVLGIPGSATITRADNQWGEVPEPASVVLTSCGLAGVAILRHRRAAARRAA